MSISVDQISWFYYAGDEHHPPLPTIKELAVFPLLDDVWEDLGRALSIDDQTLQLINQKFSTPIKKQKELFRTYLKNCLCPTWSDIIQALVKIGKYNVAKDVVDTFLLPQELLRTAKELKEPIDLSTKSATDMVDFDVPARIELHHKNDPDDSGVISWDGSTKSRVVADGQFESGDLSKFKSISQTDDLSARDNEVHSYEPNTAEHLILNKKRAKTSQVLPTTSWPKLRVESDCASERKPVTAQLPIKTEPRIVADDGGSMASPGLLHHGDPLITHDGGSPPPSKKQTHNHKSLTLNKERPRTAQIPIKLGPVEGKSKDGALTKDCGRDDRLKQQWMSHKSELSTSPSGANLQDITATRYSSGNDSLSSDDFLSAEELPLDEKKNSVSTTSKAVASDRHLQCDDGIDDERVDVSGFFVIYMFG